MTVKKLGRALFVITVLQVILSVALMLYQTNFMLHVLLLLVLLSSSVAIMGLYSVFQYQIKSYKESIQNLENFNYKLREQRHDYLNQLQIVYGLLELEEYEEAHTYLTPVFKDIMKVSKALKTAHPAVNALLQAKMEHAEKKGIDFYLEVSTSLTEMQMEAWELCKVLGNLIDNAVTALEEVIGEKQIFLEIRESKVQYHFTIRNNGPQIPEQNQKMIFFQGFTTKKEEGHGMGLPIVASVLKNAGGQISFTSETDETSFFFDIPKKDVSSNGKNDRLKTKLYK